jgi:hypothetical protein
MSETHTLLEDLGPIVIHTLLESNKKFNVGVPQGKSLSEMLNEKKYGKKIHNVLQSHTNPDYVKPLSNYSGGENGKTLVNKYIGNLGGRSGGSTINSDKTNKQHGGVIHQALQASASTKPDVTSDGGSLNKYPSNLGSRGGESTNKSTNGSTIKFPESTIHKYPNNLGGRGDKLSSKSSGGIGKYLLGLGAAGAAAAGAGAYALRDQLGDDAGEHIHSLRDKLARLFAAHHDDEA